MLADHIGSMFMTLAVLRVEDEDQFPRMVLERLSKKFE
jgi:hypothetical protein